MEIAQNEGLEVSEEKITLEDLKNADEAFFTGTAAEISPIGKVDNTPIGKGQIGEISAKLRDIYLNTVTGKVENYLNWLSFT